MNQLLDEMRGETSLPLEQALFSAFMEMLSRDMNYFTVQVPSTKLAKGISMIVDARFELEVQLFYARDEIGGFMPPSIRGELTSQNWIIVADRYGQKYAGAKTTCTRGETVQAAERVCKALELLGAPQKKTWTLEPDFKYIF